MAAYQYEINQCSVLPGLFEATTDDGNDMQMQALSKQRKYSIACELALSNSTTWHCLTSRRVVFVVET